MVHVVYRNLKLFSTCLDVDPTKSQPSSAQPSPAPQPSLTTQAVPPSPAAHVALQPQATTVEATSTPGLQSGILSKPGTPLSGTSLPGTPLSGTPRNPLSLDGGATPRSSAPESLIPSSNTAATTSKYIPL